MEHKDAVLKFLAVMTGNRRFEDAQIRLKDKEDATMIDVFQDAENRGREEGRNQVLFSLVDDGLLSPGVAAARANMSEAEFRARMERDRQDRQKGQ